MSVELAVTNDSKPSLSSRHWLWLATAILLVAASFRLVALADVPPGLAQDEVLDADIASFIRGGENALFFRHGYGHEPLYHYWAVPFQVLFGDNVLAVRLPSAYLGLLLVALTMRWAKGHFGSTAALVAGIGLAISWWPIIFSRIGIRPILEPVLLVAAFRFWPLGARVWSRQGRRPAMAAGAVLGLSIYSYTAARIIWLIPLLMLLIFALRALWVRKGGRGDETAFLHAKMGYAAVVLVVTLIVYAPLGLTLRANPDLQQRLEQLEGPLTALEAGDVGPVLREARATLGVFSFTGDPRWTYSIPHRPLFDPLTSLLFYGGLLIALGQWRKPAYLLLPIWLVVALLPSALSPDAPSTVRLVGALPVVYLLPGLAIDRLLRRLWPSDLHPLGQSARVVAALLGGFLTIILLANGYRTLRDGFVRWPQELETRLRYQSVVQDIGRYWRQSGSAAPVVAEVFYEPIDDAGLRRSLGSDLGARWIQTGAGAAGAMVWPVGDASQDNLVLVPEFAPLDPSLMAAAGLGDEPDFRSARSPSFAVYRLPPWPAETLSPVDQTFVDTQQEPMVQLVGVVPIVSEPGAIRLATGWRVRGRLPSDLAIFIHLVDQDGDIVAQFDGLDAAAETLRPGDLFLQAHLLTLPGDLPPGNYPLQLGLYSRSSGQRWSTKEGEDVLELGRCEQNDGLSLPICRLTEPS